MPAEVVDLARERDMRSLVLVRCVPCDRPLGAVLEGAEVRCPRCGARTIARRGGAACGRG